MKTTPRLFFRRPTIFVGILLLAQPFVFAADTPPAAAKETPPPMTLTAQQDHQLMMDLLHIASVRPGRSGTAGQPNYANYDESKAAANSPLPDALILKNGRKVTTPEMWWQQRRPEIVEDFDREMYGRVPTAAKNLKVTWEVIGTTTGTNGTVPTVTQQLVGHVDNSSYPAISVNIAVTLTTPANAGGPVPVMLVLSGGGGGARGARGPGTPGGAGARPGGAAGPGTGGAPVAGAGGPGAAGPGGGLAARDGGGPGGPNYQQQLLAKGWGYASISTGSVQADNGAGLTQGIIGLLNKGQPRKADDWGVLRAWAWGCSRALDYFETDKDVDAKQVGLEGHSRWGKATAVAMAYDPRFAIAYVSSSGEGGAKIWRHLVGEAVENLTATGEYHWMAGNFLKYGGPLTVDDLPVDAHELVALCAPRPVFIGGGANGDSWQDPRGMFLAAAGAGPVYRLLGKKNLGTTEMPGVQVPLIDGDIAFREHEQGHTDAPNWATFIEFASRYFKAPPMKN